MVSNNYPQITSVTSEALQAQIRTLLPSQEGFGTDLMAQNVIVPVLDLTAAAAGTAVAPNLLNAISFDDATAFDSTGTTVVVANTAGFWRITGSWTIANDANPAVTSFFQMSDGLSTKNVWGCSVSNTSGFSSICGGEYDLIFWLQSGETLSAVSNSGRTALVGSARQIADVNGKYNNPSGFSPS